MLSKFLKGEFGVTLSVCVIMFFTFFFYDLFFQLFGSATIGGELLSNSKVVFSILLAVITVVNVLFLINIFARFFRNTVANFLELPLNGQDKKVGFNDAKKEKGPFSKNFISVVVTIAVLLWMLSFLASNFRH